MQLTIGTDEIADILAEVRQLMYSEMIEGNGRQPAEVVEYVGMELLDYFKILDKDIDKDEFYSQSEPELRDEPAPDPFDK